MQTKGVRIYGADDIRLETFELPPMQDDEILAKVVTDSVCMSTYKFVKLGQAAARAHKDMANNPCIIGHELCGEIIDVGSKWQHKYQKGEKFIIQPALNATGVPDSAGFTFKYCGGNSLYIVIPRQFMELDYLIKCKFDSFYFGSLTEPLCCIARAVKRFYHTTPGFYEHELGIKQGGNMIILAGAGPMGLGAIDYCLHNEGKLPGLLVVTDVDDDRLARAEKMYPVEAARKDGIELKYVNTGKLDDPVKSLRDITGGHGYDDVLVMAPVTAVIEQGDAIMAHDGCLNFFAGPTNTELKANINFFNVHYGAHHFVGTMGGTEVDMIECADLMAKGKLDPSSMLTHIGGMNAVIGTVLNLPNIKGGKKLIYNHLDLPLIALEDLKNFSDPRLKKLGEMVDANHGRWSSECEKYLLENFSK
ncbi:MAG: zinc-binding dehydrogenase [Lachnospiraceae bacterium]|jgi:threonine dehydrogenase-like Zn-dependent dehydrogenase